MKGISLSENQIKYCKKKAKELKMDNQVTFELLDYRQVKGKFQKIVSVGAFEHFGKKFYKTFFKKVESIMSDNGICLLHTIGSVDSPGPVQPFIQKRIFPGGIIPSSSDLTKPIEKTGLIIADCETLIHHYDKTLKAWLDRFLKNKGETFSRKYFEDFFWKFWKQIKILRVFYNYGNPASDKMLTVLQATLYAPAYRERRRPCAEMFFAKGAAALQSVDLHVPIQCHVS